MPENTASHHRKNPASKSARQSAQAAMRDEPKLYLVRAGKGGEEEELVLEKI